mgnify:CR=1 FL=1
MWLLLGLLGSVTALSASDMFTAQSSSDSTTDEEEDDLQSEDVLVGRGSNGDLHLSMDYPDTDTDTDFAPDAEQVAVTSPADVGAPGAVLGLFDGLGERVHSSDTYPALPPDAPLTLHGDATDDNLHGGDLDDSLFGHDGDDRLVGHSGADWLSGGSGDDSLIGGEGDDTLSGGDGNDTLLGGLGNDLLLSGSGANTLMAGDGDDRLIGQAGASFLNGGAGNDLLQAGAGNLLHGGNGNDQFRLPEAVAEAGPAQILDYTAGEDEIQLSYDLSQGVPELSITFDPDVPDLAEIRLAGDVLAQVANAGGLSVSDIRLIAQPVT